MTSLSFVLLLAVATPAPANENIWETFARHRVPSASRGEDSGELESALQTLKTQDDRCRERLAAKDALQRRLDFYRADRETAAVESDFDEVKETLQGIDPGVTIAADDAPIGEPFAITISGPDGSRTFTTLTMIASVLPTLELDRVESTPKGWTATGRLKLLAPRPQSEPVAEIPSLVRKEGRRSSELRLRINAARPVVLECHQKLQEARLTGFFWYVQRAIMPRPRGGALRPLFDGLSRARLVDPVTLEVTDHDTVRVSYPVAAAERFRKAMAPFIAHLSEDERYEADRETISLAIATPLSSLLGREEALASEKLSAFVAAYRDLLATQTSSAYLTDPSLEAAGTAALTLAEATWPMLVESETAAVRQKALVERTAALGMPRSVDEFQKKLAGCDVQVEGRGPAADGKTWSVTLVSAHPENGPHPFACVRRTMASVRFVRFEWGTRVSRATAKVNIAPPTPANVAISALWELPAAPELPARPAATPQVEQVRTKLAALLAKVEEARKETTAAEDFQREWAEYDRLASLARPSPGAARFYDVVFEDSARIGLWFDFTAKGSGFELNANPKERSRALFEALSSAGCATSGAKDAKGATKIAYDCSRAR